MSLTEKYILNGVESNRWIKSVYSNDLGLSNCGNVTCGSEDCVDGSCPTNYCSPDVCPSVCRPFYVLNETGDVYVTTQDGLVYYLGADEDEMRLIYPPNSRRPVGGSVPDETVQVTKPFFSHVIPWRPGTTDCMVRAGTDLRTLESITISSTRDVYATPKGNGSNIRGGLVQPFSNGYYCVQTGYDKCVVFYKDTVIYDGKYSGMGTPTPFSYAAPCCPVPPCCPHVSLTQMEWEYDIFPKWKKDENGNYVTETCLERFVRTQLTGKNELAVNVLERVVAEGKFKEYRTFGNYNLTDVCAPFEVKVDGETKSYGFAVRNAEGEVVGYASVYVGEGVKGEIKEVVGAAGEDPDDGGLLGEELESGDGRKQLVGKRVFWSFAKSEICCEKKSDENIKYVVPDCEYEGLFRCTRKEESKACASGSGGMPPGRHFWYTGAGYHENQHSEDLALSRWKEEMWVSCDEECTCDRDPTEYETNIYTTHNNCKYLYGDHALPKICGKCNYPITISGDEPVWKHREEQEGTGYETFYCKAEVATVRLAPLGGRINSIYYLDGSESDWAYITISTDECRIKKDYSIVGAVSEKTDLPGYYEDGSGHLFCSDATRAVIIRAPGFLEEDDNKECTTGFPRGASYTITITTSKSGPEDYGSSQLSPPEGVGLAGWYVKKPKAPHPDNVQWRTHNATKTTWLTKKEWKNASGEVEKTTRTKKEVIEEKGRFTIVFVQGPENPEEQLQGPFVKTYALKSGSSDVYEAQWCVFSEDPGQQHCGGQILDEIQGELSRDTGVSHGDGTLLSSLVYPEYGGLSGSYQDVVYDDPVWLEEDMEVYAVTTMTRTEKQSDTTIKTTVMLKNTVVFDSGGSSFDMKEEVEVTRTTTQTIETTEEPPAGTEGNDFTIPKDSDDVLKFFLRFYPAYLTRPGYSPVLNEGVEGKDFDWNKDLKPKFCDGVTGIPSMGRSTCSKKEGSEEVDVNECLYKAGVPDNNPPQETDSDWSFDGFEQIEEGTCRWGAKWKKGDETVTIELPRPEGLCDGGSYSCLGNISNPTPGKWYCLGLISSEENAVINYAGTEVTDYTEPSAGIRWVQAVHVWGDPDGVAVRVGTQVGDVYHKPGEKDSGGVYYGSPLVYERYAVDSDKFWYWNGYEWCAGGSYFSDIGGEKAIFYKDRGDLNGNVEDFPLPEEEEYPEGTPSPDVFEDKGITGKQADPECDYSRAIFVGRVARTQACGDILAVNLNTDSEYHEAVFFREKPVWDRPAHSSEYYPDQREFLSCLGSSYTLLTYNTGEGKQQFNVWYHPYGTSEDNESSKATYTAEFDYDKVPNIPGVVDSPVSEATIARYGAENVAKTYLTMLSRDKTTLYVFHKGKLIHTYTYPTQDKTYEDAWINLDLFQRVCGPKYCAVWVGNGEGSCDWTSLCGAFKGLNDSGKKFYYDIYKDGEILYSTKECVVYRGGAFVETLYKQDGVEQDGVLPRCSGDLAARWLFCVDIGRLFLISSLYTSGNYPGKPLKLWPDGDTGLYQEKYKYMGVLLGDTEIVTDPEALMSLDLPVHSIYGNLNNGRVKQAIIYKYYLLTYCYATQTCECYDLVGMNFYYPHTSDDVVYGYPHCNNYEINPCGNAGPDCDVNVCVNSSIASGVSSRFLGIGSSSDDVSFYICFVYSDSGQSVGMVGFFVFYPSSGMVLWQPLDTCVGHYIIQYGCKNGPSPPLLPAHPEPLDSETSLVNTDEFIFTLAPPCCLQHNVDGSLVEGVPECTLGCPYDTAYVEAGECEVSKIKGPMPSDECAGLPLSYAVSLQGIKEVEPPPFYAYPTSSSSYVSSSVFCETNKHRCGHTMYMAYAVSELESSMSPPSGCSRYWVTYGGSGISIPNSAKNNAVDTRVTSEGETSPIISCCDKYALIKDENCSAEYSYTGYALYKNTVLFEYDGTLEDNSDYVLSSCCSEGALFRRTTTEGKKECCLFIEGVPVYPFKGGEGGSEPAWKDDLDYSLTCCGLDYYLLKSGDGIKVGMPSDIHKDSLEYDSVTKTYKLGLKDDATRQLEDGTIATIVTRGELSSTYGDGEDTIKRTYEYPKTWVAGGVTFYDDLEYTNIENSENVQGEDPRAVLVTKTVRHVPWKRELDFSNAASYMYYKTTAISADPRITGITCFRYENIYADDKTKMPEYHATAAYAVFYDDPRDACARNIEQHQITVPGEDGADTTHFTYIWEGSAVQNVLGVKQVGQGLSAGSRVLFDSITVRKASPPCCDHNDDFTSESSKNTFCATKGKIKESQKNTCIIVWSKASCDTSNNGLHDNDRPFQPLWEPPSNDDLQVVTDWHSAHGGGTGKTAIEVLREDVLYINDYNAAGRWDRVSGDDPVDAWNDPDYCFSANPFCAGVGGLFTSAPAYHTEQHPDNTPLDLPGRLVVSGNNVIYVFGQERDENGNPVGTPYRRDYFVNNGKRITYTGQS